MRALVLFLFLIETITQPASPSHCCTEFHEHLCVRCPPGMHLYRSNCLFDWPHCLRYEDGFDCSECEIGYEQDLARRSCVPRSTDIQPMDPAHAPDIPTEGFSALPPSSHSMQPIPSLIQLTHRLYPSISPSATLYQASVRKYTTGGIYRLIFSTEQGFLQLVIQTHTNKTQKILAHKLFTKTAQQQFIDIFNDPYFLTIQKYVIKQYPYLSNFRIIDGFKHKRKKKKEDGGVEIAYRVFVIEPNLGMREVNITISEYNNNSTQNDHKQNNKSTNSPTPANTPPIPNQQDLNPKNLDPLLKYALELISKHKDIQTHGQQLTSLKKLQTPTTTTPKKQQIITYLAIFLNKNNQHSTVRFSIDRNIGQIRIISFSKPSKKQQQQNIQQKKYQQEEEEEQCAILPPSTRQPTNHTLNAIQFMRMDVISASMDLVPQNFRHACHKFRKEHYPMTIGAPILEILVAENETMLIYEYLYQLQNSNNSQKEQQMQSQQTKIIMYQSMTFSLTKQPCQQQLSLIQSYIYPQTHQQTLPLAPKTINPSLIAIDPRTIGMYNIAKFTNPTVFNNGAISSATIIDQDDQVRRIYFRVMMINNSEEEEEIQSMDFRFKLIQNIANPSIKQTGNTKNPKNLYKRFNRTHDLQTIKALHNSMQIQQFMPRAIDDYFLIAAFGSKQQNTLFKVVYRVGKQLALYSINIKTGFTYSKEKVIKDYYGEQPQNNIPQAQPDQQQDNNNNQSSPSQKKANHDPRMNPPPEDNNNHKKLKIGPVDITDISQNQTITAIRQYADREVAERGQVENMDQLAFVKMDRLVANRTVEIFNLTYKGIARQFRIWLALSRQDGHIFVQQFYEVFKQAQNPSPSSQKLQIIEKFIQSNQQLIELYEQLSGDRLDFKKIVGDVEVGDEGQLFIECSEGISYVLSEKMPKLSINSHYIDEKIGDEGKIAAAAAGKRAISQYLRLTDDSIRGVEIISQASYAGAIRRYSARFRTSSSAVLLDRVIFETAINQQDSWVVIAFTSSQYRNTKIQWGELQPPSQQSIKLSQTLLGSRIAIQSQRNSLTNQHRQINLKHYRSGNIKLIFDLTTTNPHKLIAVFYPDDGYSLPKNKQQLLSHPQKLTHQKIYNQLLTYVIAEPNQLRFFFGRDKHFGSHMQLVQVFYESDEVVVQVNALVSGEQINITSLNTYANQLSQLRAERDRQQGNTLAQVQEQLEYKISYRRLQELYGFYLFAFEVVEVQVHQNDDLLTFEIYMESSQPAYMLATVIFSYKSQTAKVLTLNNISPSQLSHRSKKLQQFGCQQPLKNSSLCIHCRPGYHLNTDHTCYNNLPGCSIQSGKLCLHCTAGYEPNPHIPFSCI